VPKAGAARARAMLPKIDADDPDTLRVSEDFDWGRDDAKSGHSRLERTSKAIREPRRRRHLPRREEKPEPKPRFEKPKPATEDQEPDLARKDDAHTDEVAETKPIVIDRTPRKAEVAKTDSTRVLYRVVPGDSLQQIAATVGLTVDQVLAQAHVMSASEIQVGTLLDLRVPAKGIRD
jgi:hypothetical protein